MRLISCFVEKIISYLKNDKSYKFKMEYTDRQLSEIILLRTFQVLRGFRYRIKFSSVDGLFFAGRGIVLEHGNQIKAGSNLILDDAVSINALSEKGVTFGRNVTISKNTIIVCTGVVANKGVGIEIGDYSAVGAQSFLGGQGGIKIGCNVIMGPGVRIFSENHNYGNLSVPIRLQGEVRKGVVIEDDCWIGSGVTVLDGVTIGTGSIVAAGSVVTRSMEPFSIIAGVPAHVIKSRCSSTISE